MGVAPRLDNGVDVMVLLDTSLVWLLDNGDDARQLLLDTSLVWLLGGGVDARQLLLDTSLVWLLGGGVDARQLLLDTSLVWLLGGGVDARQLLLDTSVASLLLDVDVSMEHASLMALTSFKRRATGMTTKNKINRNLNEYVTVEGLQEAFIFTS